MTRILLLETCSDCPHCHYNKINCEYTCQHPLHPGDVLTLDNDDDECDYCIDVTETISDACPLEEAT